jgi:deoxyribonuclease-1
MRKFLILTACFLIAGLAHTAAPQSFELAKALAREQVYHDQNMGSSVGTLYCGCDWGWVGRSGGRVDLSSCGYEPRAQATRAARIEWEYIVPAHNFGHQRQCWQSGGRAHCKESDPVFRAMEADLHNLAPAVGEVNADRSNLRYGMVTGVAPQYGACPTKVDFKARVAEPRDAVKGFVARVTFYMHDRYDLSMSDAQQRLLMAWDASYPVSRWELERDRRIAKIMGHSNPFVTGARHWTRGHRNSKEGLVAPIPAGHPALRSERPSPASRPQGETKEVVIGNRNSKIYHLPQGCPSYAKVSPQNQVRFDTEAQAQAAGFRKAGNCRW